MPVAKYYPTTDRRIVGSTATRILSVNQNRVGATIKALPTNSETVYVGDENVSTGIGFPLDPGESLPTGTLDGALWAISASGGQHVAIYANHL